MIEPRVEEIYSLVQQVMRESGYEELLSSGIVLTGGSALMQGMVELGEDIFHMPVRVGVPTYAGGAGRRGAQPALRDGDGPAARGREHRAHARPQGRGAADRCRRCSARKDWFIGESR